MSRHTRRSFLQAGAAAGCASPFFVRASSMSFADNPVVGSGAFAYECIHN